MLTLSYGYYQPETGDLGSVWFPRMEDNMERLNDHSHNGVDSALLAPVAITKYSSTIAAASWSATAGGTYSQVVTVPAGVTEINLYNIHFYVTSTGVRVLPTVERASATTYTIYTNDNTLALTAKYV